MFVAVSYPVALQAELLAKHGSASLSMSEDLEIACALACPQWQQAVEAYHHGVGGGVGDCTRTVLTFRTVLHHQGGCLYAGPADSLERHIAKFDWSKVLELKGSETVAASRAKMQKYGMTSKASEPRPPPGLSRPAGLDDPPLDNPPPDCRRLVPPPPWRKPPPPPPQRAQAVAVKSEPEPEAEELQVDVKHLKQALRDYVQLSTLQAADVQVEKLEQLNHEFMRAAETLDKLAGPESEVVNELQGLLHHARTGILLAQQSKELFTEVVLRHSRVTFQATHLCNCAIDV